MEELINANSPEEQTAALNSLLNKTNEAIQGVLDSTEVLNQKAIQLRNHEMVTAKDDTLGHIKSSDELVVDEITKQLKVHPDVVDNRLTHHNELDTAHPDIRASLDVIPKVITGVSMSGPGTVKTGVSSRFTVSAISLLVGSHIDRFEVVMPDGEVLAKSGINIENNSTYFDLTLVGDDLSEHIVKVRATDNFGSKSEYYEHTIVVSTNNPPVLDAAVVNNLPVYIKPGAEHTVNITGGIDEDGDIIKYSITNISDNNNIVFSKTSNIADGENITITLNSNIQRDRTYSFVVVGDDGRFGGTASKVFNFRTNNLPISSGVVITGVPTYVAPGKDYIVKLSGAADLDTQDLSYFISSNDTKVTFSKASGLVDNEEFTMSVGSTITRGTVISLTVVVTDGLEYSASKVFTNITSVNVLPDVTNFDHTVPNKMYPGQTISVAFTGVVDSTTDGGLYLDLDLNSEDYVFGKTRNVLVGESISLTCKGTATRGASTTVTITAKDGVESVTKTTSVLTNRLPNNTNLELHGLVPFITNDKTYTLKLSGSTDADSDTLVYSIESSAGNKITYSKSSGISANEEFTMYTDGLIQNTTVTFTVTVFDGMESTQKVFTTVVNSIPVSTNVEFTLPKIVKPNTAYPGIVLYGGQDTDVEQTLVYSISSNNAGVTFSKSEGLASNEAISVNFSDIARGTLISFTVTISDGVDSSSKGFTAQINNLPVVTAVASTITGSAVSGYIQPNQSYVLKLAGAVDADATQTLTYGIEVDTEALSFSKTSGIIANESVTLVAASSIERGTTPEFTVSVTDGLETVTKVLTPVVVNSLPDLSSVGLTNVPDFIKPNDSKIISVSGATDVNSDQSLRYSLSCNKAYVTFSKTSNITANESITMSYASNAVRGETPVITVSVTDGLETVSTNINSAKVNTLPNMSSVAISGMPGILKPDSTATIKVAGATDTDGQNLVYALSCDKGYVTFSKSTNIVANESVVMTYSAAAVRGETPVIVVTVSDGLEVSTKNINASKVNTLPVITNVGLNSVPNYIKPNDTATITVSGATDTDGQTLKYALVCNKNYVTFSKNSDIDANTSLTMTYASNAVRGETPAITISVTDGLETVTKVVNSAIVNTAPNANGISITGIPAVMKPTSNIGIQVSGATDIDSQVLLYSLASDKPYVTFSKTSNIAANESVTMTYSSSATRGETPVITVGVTDGLEVASKNITNAKVNTLPVTTSAAITGIPEYVRPGDIFAVAVTGVSDVDGQTLSYSLTSSDTNVTFTPVSGNTFNMTIGASIVRGSKSNITLVVNDGLENSVSKVFTDIIKVNVLPDISNFTHNIPVIMYPGQTIPVSFSGVVDASTSGGCTITIKDISSNFVFGKTSGIALNESVSLMCAASATRGYSNVFTIEIHDGYETVSTTVTSKVNRLINTTNLVLNGLPPFITNDASYELSLAGATDADGQAVRYSISSNVPSSITYSKSANLANNESFTMYTDGLVQNTTVTFTVVATDGLETQTKYFTAVVNSIPISANVEFVLPTLLKPNSTYNNVVVYGGQDVDTDQTLTYSISSNNTNVTFSKASGLAANESFNVIVGDAARGAVVTFKVTVSDGVDSSFRNFNKTINTLPNMSAVSVNNLPNIVAPNTTTSINIVGATDVDAQALSYSVSCDKAYVSFSKTTGLSSGENFNIVYASSAVRGEVPNITVTASDGLETNTKVIASAKVNTLPVSTGIGITGIPALLAPSGSSVIKVSGATDVDSQTLTYSLSCNKAYVSFSKASGIAANENVTMIYSAAAVRGETPVITVTVSDGLETASKNINSAKVNTLPVVTGVNVTGVPAYLKPGTTYPIQIAGATDVDSGQTLSYSIASSLSNAVLSKTSGIAANESINLTANSGIGRGNALTLTVTVSDGLESTDKVFTSIAAVNRLPVATSIDITGIPAYIKPTGTATIKVSGATDADSGQTLVYSLSCNKAYVTFSKTSGIAANENVTMTYSSAAIRGEQPVITVTVSDGLETNSKNINSAGVNQLPDVSGVVATGLPTVAIKGGTAYTFTLTGATDADGQALSYKITGGSGLNLSPTSGIVADSNISLNATKVSTQQAINFTVNVVDSLGEQSTTGKQFTVTVDPIVRVTTPSLISPTAGQTISLPFTFQGTAYDTYIELDD